MQTEMVLTVIGHDRPGLVETIAESVASHGGNWVDSSMSRLGGEFAGIVRVLIPEDKTAALEKELTELDRDEKISVTVRKNSPNEDSPTGQLASFELLGHDQIGIVLKITQILARHQVNVLDLETSVTSASMEGSPMFKAVAELRLPDNIDIAALEEALETIANDIMVDIDLKTG